MTIIQKYNETNLLSLIKHFIPFTFSLPENNNKFSFSFYNKETAVFCLLHYFTSCFNDGNNNDLQVINALHNSS